MAGTSKTYNVYGITAIVAVSGFLLGLESTSLANVLNSKAFEDFFTPPTTGEKIMIEAGNSIGAVFGCVLGGALYDSLGCIHIFRFAGCLWILGTAVMVFSPYILLLVLGRCLKGCALGFISTAVPVYIAETIPTKKKGISISIVLLCSAIGSLAMYLCSHFSQTIFDEDIFFRYVWGLECAPSILLLLLCFFLPESPKWLASHSKWQEATKSLRKIRNYNHLDMNSPVFYTSERDYVLRAYTAGSEIKTCTYGHIFGKRYWKHTLLGIAAQSFVQLTAMGIFTNSFISICEACGIPDEDLWIFMFSQYFLTVIFTSFPIFLLDNCRRKDSLTFGFFILGLTHVSLCVITLVFGEEIDESFAGSLFNFDIFELAASAVVALFFFLHAVYASTLISASWLYIGEIFPSPARAKGSAVCMCVSWMINANLTLLFPLLIEYIGVWIFLVVAVFCFISTFLCSMFPETRDLNEIEIEALFDPIINNKGQSLPIEYFAPKSLEDNIPIEETQLQNNKMSNPDKNSQFPLYEMYKPKMYQQEEEIAYEMDNLKPKDDNEMVIPTQSPELEEEEEKLPTVDKILLSFSDSSNSFFNNKDNVSQDSKNASVDLADQDIVDAVGSSSKGSVYVSNNNKYGSVNDIIEEYEAPVHPNSSADESYYSSDWFDHVAPKNAKKKLKPKRSHINSGTSFFHGNREGSPKKAGLTYEPTTFLNYDSLKLGHKPSFKED